MCISIKTALKTAIINFAQNSASSGMFRHLGFKILLNPRWRKCINSKIVRQKNNKDRECQAITEKKKKKTGYRRELQFLTDLGIDDLVARA